MDSTMVGIVGNGGESGSEWTKSQKEGAGGVGAQNRYRWTWYQKYGTERTGKTARRRREGSGATPSWTWITLVQQRDSHSEVSKRSCMKVCRVHQKDQDQRGESGVLKTEKLRGDKGKRIRRGNEIKKTLYRAQTRAGLCPFIYESEMTSKRTLR